ncbi:hypothetical protein NDN08_008012 [Rhodosorus marinus]|uniref:Uncharacterized protein n=1 Tax=Rhodosorus marinus TaxID=101924 RepID=A0AAV8UZ91_9RHOD|nr:hypothetical protein NDN08_008012 [Rhodosorus marinus]
MSTTKKVKGRGQVKYKTAGWGEGAEREDDVVRWRKVQDGPGSEEQCGSGLEVENVEQNTEDSPIDEVREDDSSGDSRNVEDAEQKLRGRSAVLKQGEDSAEDRGSEREAKKFGQGSNTSSIDWTEETSDKRLASRGAPEEEEARRADQVSCVRKGSEDVAIKKKKDVEAAPRLVSEKVLEVVGEAETISSDAVLKLLPEAMKVLKVSDQRYLAIFRTSASCRRMAQNAKTETLKVAPLKTDSKESEAVYRKEYPNARETTDVVARRLILGALNLKHGDIAKSSARKSPDPQARGEHKSHGRSRSTKKSTREGDNDGKNPTQRPGSPARSGKNKFTGLEPEWQPKQNT